MCKISVSDKKKVVPGSLVKALGLNPASSEAKTSRAIAVGATRCVNCPALVDVLRLKRSANSVPGTKVICRNGFLIGLMVFVEPNETEDCPFKEDLSDPALSGEFHQNGLAIA